MWRRLLLCHELEIRPVGRSVPQCHAVQVSGATGQHAASINGVYRPVAGEGVGGKPVYKKDGADVWIEYWPGREQWQLKPGSDKGRESAYMHSLGNQKEAGVVEEVTAGWNVADGNSFSEQAGVRVVRHASAVQGYPFFQQPAPSFFQQPAPTFFQQPAPSFFQQPAPSFFQQPAPTPASTPFSSSGFDSFFGSTTTSVPGSAGAASIGAASSVTEEAKLLQLAEMGFSDGSANKELLAELNFDMGAVIERLAGNAQASEQQQQLLSRLSDVASEPLGVLTPIMGIGATPRLPLMDAAIASGVPDMDAHGFVAAEHGAALARNDPHGLDQDETAAISLYTHESELYPTLNDLLRQHDRKRLKPFFPYLRLLMDARRKLPRHVGTVWRGVKGVDLRSKYQKGSEVYWWAFSSTTKELSTLQNPNFLGTSGVRTVFNIQVKRMK